MFSIFGELIGELASRLEWMRLKAMLAVSRDRERDGGLVKYHLPIPVAIAFAYG